MYFFPYLAAVVRAAADIESKIIAVEMEDKALEANNPISPN